MAEPPPIRTVSSRWERCATRAGSSGGLRDGPSAAANDLLRRKG